MTKDRATCPFLFNATIDSGKLILVSWQLTFYEYYPPEKDLSIRA